MQDQPFELGTYKYQPVVPFPQTPFLRIHGFSQDNEFALVTWQGSGILAYEPIGRLKFMNIERISA